VWFDSAGVPGGLRVHRRRVAGVVPEVVANGIPGKARKMLPRLNSLPRMRSARDSVEAAMMTHVHDRRRPGPRGAAEK
jgi:hypothetical protein